MAARTCSSRPTRARRFPYSEISGTGLFADITDASGVGRQTAIFDGMERGDLRLQQRRRERSVRGLRLDRRQRGGVFASRFPPDGTCVLANAGAAKIRRRQRAGRRRFPKGRLESRRRVRRSGWRWARRCGGEPDRRARGDFPEYVRRAQSLSGGASARGGAATATVSAPWFTSPARPAASSGIG